MRVHRKSYIVNLLALALVTLALHAEEEWQTYYARLCQYPFRSLDGTNFVSLYPKFFYLTNHAYLQTAPDPMRDWLLVKGTVLDAARPSRDGILVALDRTRSSPAVSPGDIIHLDNYPGASQLVDGSPIACLAHRNGAYQYHDIRGAVSTVPSYDHGIIASAEQTALIRQSVANKYKPLLDARTNRSKPLSSTNYTITPPTR